MLVDANQINIMTSSDERLMPKIKVQLEAISHNLPKKEINFYLFHDGKLYEAIDLLHRFSKHFSNINFFDIAVRQADLYDRLSVMGGGQIWGGAAYYSLCAYQYLPLSMDRILYLDAGDTLVIHPIDEFYFADFHGRSLLAVAGCFKRLNQKITLFEKDDLFNSIHVARVLRGLFNSGSYLINLEKFRVAGLTIEECLQYAEALCVLVGKEHEVYWGDQGFLSALFVGDIQFYKYPEIKNIWYMPYNFCMWYFDRMVQKADYTPCILHYAGTPFKPWHAAYPIFCDHFQERNGLHSLDELKLGQAEYYYLWHEYAILAEQRERGAV